MAFLHHLSGLIRGAVVRPACRVLGCRRVQGVRVDGAELVGVLQSTATAPSAAAAAASGSAHTVVESELQRTLISVLGTLHLALLRGRLRTQNHLRDLL